MKTNPSSAVALNLRGTSNLRRPIRARFYVLTLVTFLTLINPLFPALASSPPSPFAVNATMTASNSVAWVTFDFLVPPDHVLYAERLAFLDADGQAVKPASIPEPVMHLDAVSGQQKLVYDHAFSATLKLGPAFPSELLVKFQGCSNSACYFPEKHYYTVNTSGIAAKAEKLDAQPPALAAASSQVHTNGFKIAARETGYISKKAFLEFLEQSITSRAGRSDPLEKLNSVGPLASLFLIVLGGIGLNLTPCVLPLIPINLAIIGAGARANSRRRGFGLGGTYGLGMALVYGALGLVVVLGGAKFGTLNSSAWFNTAIAAVFLVLSLGMFDLINIDFSRFQGRTGGSGSSQKGPFLLALSMGAMAALLAGACVAPVVISVLLMASQLYAKGAVLGLLLPFLLGLGMALPWPFAGAGLSFLPKPGQWMKWVKYSFGVLILVFGAYYGHLAYSIFRSDATLVASAKSAPSGNTDSLGSNAALAAGLQQARAIGKPLLIDFATSWCKNCVAMDATVFSAPEVKQRLNDFVVVRYDAEKPNEPPAKNILNQFGVIGLPTYVVLVPQK